MIIFYVKCRYLCIYTNLAIAFMFFNCALDKTLPKEYNNNIVKGQVLSFNLFGDLNNIPHLKGQQIAKLG